VLAPSSDTPLKFIHPWTWACEVEGEKFVVDIVF